MKRFPMSFLRSLLAASVSLLASGFLTVSFLTVGASLAAIGADSNVVPPDSLVLGDIPEIPVALAENVSRYNEFRGASFADWHPTRREMLVSTRFADASQIHRLKMPGGARTQVTFFAEPVSSASFSPRDGESLVFSKDNGGDEFYQLYRLGTRRADVLRLTDGIKRHSRGAWSRGGEWMAYSKVDGDTQGASTELWVVNPEDYEQGRLVTSLAGGGWFVSDWFPGDTAMLVSERISANEGALWRVDVKSGERRRVTPPQGDQPVSWGGGDVAADGRTVYMTTDQGDEFERLVALDTERGTVRTLSSHVSWDVDSLALSHDGKTLAYVTNEGGWSVLRLIDLATGKERVADGAPRGVMGSLGWHRNNRDLAFTVSSARSSSDVYSLDLETLAVTRWTESETGGLDVSGFVEPELVRWKSADGLLVSGFLYRPDSARFPGRRPVIVNIHGGPEGQSRPGFLGRNNYYLEELGVALLYPNVRGSSGFGKTFLKLDNGFLREGSYDDIEALFDWLAKAPALDAQRVLVTGGSYGGHMTFAVATRYADRIRAAVAVVGISNLRTFLQNTQGYRRDLRRVEYGDERDSKMYEFLERIAPMNHIDQISKPMLIVHGRNDPRVPVSESDQIVAQLKRLGVPVWYLVAEDEGHGFRKRKNADFQFYTTVLFVERFLLVAMEGSAAAL